MLLVSLLCSAVGLGCSSAPLNADGGKADRIIIVKSKHTMVLMANGKPLKSYRVALGKSDGAKERQGDHKTPEGEYVIDQKNAQSRFHLALHVSYPNAADRKRAHDAGNPGTDGTFPFQRRGECSFSAEPPGWAAVFSFCACTSARSRSSMAVSNPVGHLSLFATQSVLRTANTSSA